MKQNKESYENLQELNETIVYDFEETIPSCREKIEVKINSCLGFIWLLITGYWFNYIYNYLKEKKYKCI